MGFSGAQIEHACREAGLLCALAGSLGEADIPRVCELGADIIWRNGFYETADFYGPEMLERFLGDRLRREAQAARAGGMLVNYTVHTGVMPILDYLAGLPMDSLFGIDIAFEGVDLAAVQESHGDALVSEHVVAGIYEQGVEFLLGFATEVFAEQGCHVGRALGSRRGDQMGAF